MRLKESEYNRMMGLFLEADPSLSELGAQALLIIERKISALTLQICCGREIEGSTAHQAALLTTLNCGKRSFKGGVFVKLEVDPLCVLPAFKGHRISKVIKKLGARSFISMSQSPTRTINIGNVSGDVQEGLYLHFSSWRGGFSMQKSDSDILTLKDEFPLGAVGAAALAVGCSFLSATNLDPLADKIKKGISFWDLEELDWSNKNIVEPLPTLFPQKLWSLGLGHLGQGYAWTLGMLPLDRSNPLSVTLQDFDVVEKGNYEAGVLNEMKFVGVKKARVVASYLESAGIRTTIVERRYNQNFQRNEDDPLIMLSGLDNSATRRQLRIEEFNSIMDFGLGGNSGTFDLIRFYNLPFAGKPEDIWDANNTELQMEALRKLTEKLNGCGYVKGIAVSFVGVFASCLAVAELLKSYHGGRKTIQMNLSMRQLSKRKIVIDGNYRTELFSGQVPLLTNC